MHYTEMVLEHSFEGSGIYPGIVVSGCLYNMGAYLFSCSFHQLVKNGKPVGSVGDTQALESCIIDLGYYNKA